MHYVRLLKTPQFFAGAGNRPSSVSALITITSDLGDSFFCRDTIVTAELLEDNTPMKCILASREYLWKGGMRSLKIELSLTPTKPTSASTVLLVVSGMTGGTPPADDLSQPNGNLEVITAYSRPFRLVGGKGAEGFVQRRFSIGQDEVLRIWEETGESISRHIWDGGLALTAYLAQNNARYSSGNGKLSALHNQLVPNRNLKVLEIGSGCGIVGLALASLHNQSHVTLTDLPLAGEIIQRNLEHASPHRKVLFEALDWDQSISTSLTSQHWDVVLVADCTYNVASAPALVKVLVALVENSPDTVVVLAHKKRHDSEVLFFELMGTYFEVVDRIGFNNGGQEAEVLVDLYTFRLNIHKQ